MKPLAKSPTPAAVALLRQATAIAPKRKKASDGLLPSAAHVKQNPNSDHNTGYAVDLTHDPKHGIDCKVLFEQFKKDKRVKYLIHNGRIWVRGSGEKAYTGSNPHRTHLHVSIRDGYGSDVSPWFTEMKKPKVKPAKKAAKKPEAKPKKKAVKPAKEVKYNANKSIIASLIRKTKKKSVATCTCKTCPVHKKGK